MKVLKNIIKVISSNIVTIASGIAVSFLLPKIISLSDYGFYKTFTLYFGYLGVLSLGVIDGIVLRYGEKDYTELDREKFRSYFIWYFIFHAIVTALILSAAFVTGVPEYRFIILFLGLNLIPANLIGYFQQISQITQRFKEYSARKILQSLCNVLFVFLLFLLCRHEFVVTYRHYLWGLLAINLLLLVWYIVTYRSIIFGPHAKLKASFPEVISLAKEGFPLLVANLCSTLLLSLDRQFVNVLFDNEAYATYAFAYSILSLITVATSAISIVLYPVFKRADKEVLKRNYGLIQSVLLIFMFLAMLVYFPLVLFIGWFLPQYTPSLPIFRIILPSLAISAAITVVMHNYYKVFGKSTAFFKKSVVALVVSFASNAVAYLVFRSEAAISIASVFSLAVWYLDTGRGLATLCGTNRKSTLYMFLMCVLFYAATWVPNIWIGLAVYFAGLVLVSVLFFYQDTGKIRVLLVPPEK